MARIARNIVEFTVGLNTFRAVFNHQHCEESRDKVKAIMDAERKKILYVVPLVLKPLVIDGKDGQRRICKTHLRHITACRIHKLIAGSEELKTATKWEEVGEGYSFCSVNDNYDWRKGIKRALVDAIEDGQFLQGPMLRAFYTELRSRGPQA